MQPLLTQVPSNRLRSTIAAFIPAPASRTARDGPACPVPIMIASYVVAISPPVTPINNRQLLRQPGQTMPMFFVAGPAAAFGGKIVLVPPLEIVLRRQRYLAGFWLPPPNCRSVHSVA